MNLVLNSLDGDLAMGPVDSLRTGVTGLGCDVVLANPPFNMADWGYDSSGTTPGGSTARRPGGRTSHGSSRSSVSCPSGDGLWSSWRMARPGALGWVSGRSASVWSKRMWSRHSGSPRRPVPPYPHFRVPVVAQQGQRRAPRMGPHPAARPGPVHRCPEVGTAYRRVPGQLSDDEADRSAGRSMRGAATTQWEMPAHSLTSQAGASPCTAARSRRPGRPDARALHADRLGAWN